MKPARDLLEVPSLLSIGPQPQRLNARLHAEGHAQLHAQVHAHGQPEPEVPPQQPGSPPVEPDEGQLPPVGEPSDPDFQRIPDSGIAAAVVLHVVGSPARRFGPARGGRRRGSLRRSVGDKAGDKAGDNAGDSAGDKATLARLRAIQVATIAASGMAPAASGDVAADADCGALRALAHRLH